MMNIRKEIIKYTNIDINKLQESYDKVKDIVHIEGVSLLKVKDKINNEVYSNIKSWRSNVIEGNTTKIEKLIELINLNLRDYLGEEIKLLDSENNIEEKEIINLAKAYNNDLNFLIKDILKSNYILGDGILKNQFDNWRGKIKPANNYVSYKLENDFVVYSIYFCDYENVKDELEKLLNFVRANIKEADTFSKVFSLAIIFNLEFNRIHPCVDGNGRTGRIFFEKIFEDSGFIPLIFVTNESKLTYKQLLFNCDKDNLSSNRYYYDDIIDGFLKMYNNETQYLLEIIDNHFIK